MPPEGLQENGLERARTVVPVDRESFWERLVEWLSGDSVFRVEDANGRRSWWQVHGQSNEGTITMQSSVEVQIPNADSDTLRRSMQKADSSMVGRKNTAVTEVEFSHTESVTLSAPADYLAAIGAILGILRVGDTPEQRAIYLAFRLAKADRTPDEVEKAWEKIHAADEEFANRLQRFIVREVSESQDARAMADDL